MDLSAYTDLLAEKFGYPGLRPGQSEILAALETSDVLAVLPTGSGKSMAYVLPALVSSRVLVVSPHIALMQDQVEGLVANGVRAAFINSNLTNAAKRNNYLAFRDGNLDLLYTSPESLSNERFVNGLSNVGINLFAIDEAHCVSEWGHTFRPDYLRLDAVRKRLGSPRTIALTATATVEARNDIAGRLGLDGAKVVVHSVDRPNLNFSVEYAGGNQSKQDFLIDYAQGRPGQSGIVYAGSRKRTEELEELLSHQGLRAAHYHAGMSARERSETQRAFMTDEIDVMVATNAFGLGVDKPDVRYVMHYDMPSRLEAYYQESGRAGRDGEPSDCVLIYTTWSAQSPRRFIEADHPTRAELRLAWKQIYETSGQGESIAESVFGHLEGSVMAIRAFQKSGLIDAEVTKLLSDSPNPRIDSTGVDRHRDHEFKMLERMLGYAQTLGCRRSYILEYFGEKAVESCGSCDNCQRAIGTNLSGLVERLIALRSEISQRERMDPVDVFEDRTAREIAEKLPLNNSELLGVWGIGPVRSRRWGPQLLAEVHEWQRENPEAAQKRSTDFGMEKLSASHSRRPGNSNMPLFQVLREWRKTRAQEEGVPAFVVFSDRTLASMAEIKPTNMEELFTVFGVGSAKRDRFGVAVLKVIAEFRE